MGDHVLIRCHCGQLTDTVQLQHSIPVESILCHCDSCRHCTGALTFSALRLFSPPDSAFTTKLVKYASSNKLWRYFCETCGSHVCYYVVEENSWGVCAGVIEGAIDDRRGRLQIFIGHEFVRDTKDGGLLPIFPTSTVYPGDYNGESVQDWKTALADLKVNVEVNDSTDSLPGECHCGSVRFTVGRPDISSSSSRWGAGVCACRSCRLSCGQTLVPWAFNIPFAKIQWSDGGVLDGNLHSSLQRFVSSDHAFREFCKTCGASVFFYSSKQPGEVDINFGILRAKEGLLARSRFKWDADSIHYPEDAVDMDLIKTLQENIGSLKD